MFHYLFVVLSLYSIRAVLAGVIDVILAGLISHCPRWVKGSCVFRCRIGRSCTYGLPWGLSQDEDRSALEKFCQKGESADCPKSLATSLPFHSCCKTCWLPSLALSVVVSLSLHSDGFSHHQRGSSLISLRQGSLPFRVTRNPSLNAGLKAGTHGRTQPTSSGWKPSASSTNVRIVGTG